jgi:TonB family protein
MTAAIMFYAVVVGLLLIPAALLADRAATLRRASRRWIWAATLLLTLALPALAPWRATGDREGPAAADMAITSATTGGSLTWTVVATSARDGVSTLASMLVAVEPWAATLWLATSAGVACVYAAGFLVLARRRRQWTDAIVLGSPVLIAAETGPAVVGLASPVIVLPQWTERLEQDELAIILRHEREHVAARDPWLVHGAGLATLLMPWNPVVWWMAARLRLALEFDCDSRVLASGAGTPGEVARYGELLLAITTRDDAVVPFAAPALIESSSTLSRRIAAMCVSRVRFSRTKMYAAGVGALALLAAACNAPVPAGPGEEPEVSRPAGPEPTRGADLSSGRADTPAAAVPAAAQSAFDAPGIRRPGPGVTNPRVIREVRPNYTAAAMRQKVTGTVELEALVGVDGLVKDVRITKSLDKEFGLDEEAIKAAREWRFEPATADGKPVPIVVTLVESFTIH